MKWAQVFTSAIGKKLVMGFTGIFLILFLIVHCGINACIFLNDQGKTFDAVAHFMGTNWIMHFLELGLFVGLILHIVQGLMLTAQNRSKRPLRYQVNRAGQNSTWYSRSMGLLGSLILIFLVIHLSNFWAPNRYHYFFQGHEDDLYQRMRDAFSHGWAVLIYLAGLFSLSWHLMHGFQSAFRTLGLHSKKYIPLITGLGTAYSIVIPLVFALMPVLMYFGVIH